MGAARRLRFSGALAGGGLAISLLVGHPAIALLGFGIVGLGVANLIPILFSAAGAAIILSTRATLAALQAVTTEAITRNPEATHA